MPISESTPTTAVYKGIKTAEGLALLTSEPIAVVVGTGDATTTWHLPKELLINASPFFAAALKGNFAETTSRTIHLPEDNTDAFALFIQWLYVGEISCKKFLHGDETSGDQFLVHRDDLSIDSPVYATQVYLQACILGDKLGCLIFMDHAMLELIERYEYVYFRPETMLFIFEHFGPGSKLRRFAIDQFRLDLQSGGLHGGATPFIHVSRSHGDIGPELLEVALGAKDVDIDNPHEHSARYMQVLTVTEED